MSNSPFAPKTSYVEYRFLEFWSKQGIPYQLHHQYEIPHHSGRFSYYADFAHIESRTIIEIDGAAYHTSPEQIERDQRRQEYLESLGWTVIRFTAKQVYSDPVRTVLRAARAIERNAYALGAS
ncbi:endonuclease domain-containing protein [Dictyobacter aurantiacus]|uniref:Restriction endonuclease type II-like domain-containing protein n=1 Tax=Dictyobacter aurantiacus TaxID=1936993 RepID=A0A401ZCU0_9CHLR|nr:DUF559 domain-containing protein [Dictyobacter aurantiacus]GCE04710.1 hypothetical protein KDAU_20390 [Dictyobacter aurantiacus]